MLASRSRTGLVALALGLSLGLAAPVAAAEDAAAPEADSRRTTFIGTIGALALLIGGVGAYLSLKRRRKEQPAPAPAPAESAAPVVRIVQPAPRAMTCPTCRAEYAVGDRFCKRDGNRLVPTAEMADPRAPAGSVCPVCDHGYDPGVSMCPSDGEELVPWALRERLSEPGSERTPVKICPTCGSRYPSGCGFCRSDGTALVLVN